MSIESLSLMHDVGTAELGVLIKRRELELGNMMPLKDHANLDVSEFVACLEREYQELKNARGHRRKADEYLANILKLLEENKA